MKKSDIAIAYEFIPALMMVFAKARKYKELSREAKALIVSHAICEMATGLIGSINEQCGIRPQEQAFDFEKLANATLARGNFNYASAIVYIGVLLAIVAALNRCNKLNGTQKRELVHAAITSLVAGVEEAMLGHIEDGGSNLYGAAASASAGLPTVAD